MDNELFLNASELQFNHSTTSTWQSSSAIHFPVSHHHQPPPPASVTSNSFFDSSTLTSIVSSPVTAQPPHVTGETFIIGELISNIPNHNSNSNSSLDSISISLSPYNHATNSRYNTPPTSPPKQTTIMENLPSTSNNTHTFPNINLLNHSNSLLLGSSAADNLPAMPGDPGFAERAARFSSFGSRSFNGRGNTHNTNNNNTVGPPPKSPQFVGTSNGISRSRRKLQRVLSSPSLQVQTHQPQQQPQQQQQRVSSRFCGGGENSRENSSGSGGENNSNVNNSRKRKSSANIPCPSSKMVVECHDLPTNRKKLSRNNSLVKTEENGSQSSDDNEQQQKQQQQQLAAEPPKQDYIHVRARRGQATDSHSLAERVRREKIGERMKLLQDLVPGCNKIIGKALMLEEIINYVQSLQRQVEFLSMKLASVNPFSTEEVHHHPNQKDMFHGNCSMTAVHHPLMESASSQHQSGMVNSTTTTGCSIAMDPLHQHHHNHGGNNNDVASLQLQQSHLLNAISDSVLELQSLCESDLQTIVQMGLFSRRDQQHQPQSIDRVVNH